MINQNKKLDTYRLTSLGILTAIIIVLQIFSTFVKFGPFSITLALIPIVIGAAIFGVAAGAYLGAVFGVVVLLMCIFGADVGGAMVWNASPLICAILVILKGALAGFEAGVHYRALAQTNRIVATVVAALICPVVNTGIFVLGMMIFFKDTLKTWAGGSDVLYYIIFGLTGVNFLIEVGTNMLLCPVVAKIMDAVKKNK